MSTIYFATTNNINLLGMIIGPATGISLISIPLINFLYFKDKKFFKHHIIAISQLFLLLVVSQGRADYFSSPIILIFIGNKLKAPNINYSNFLTRFLNQLLLDHFLTLQCEYILHLHR